MQQLLRFRPTDEELFSYYLVGKATGAPLPPGLIEECDVYSEEPWKIFDAASDRTFYVFTTLRKKKSRVLRTAGTGTWKEQHAVEIRDVHGELVGHKKSFKFKGGSVSRATSGRWIMYEFSMRDEMQCKYVLCMIKYHKDEKKSEEKAIVISDDESVQFKDENPPAKRLRLLDNHGDWTNLIYDSAATLPLSTVDEAQPASSQAISSGITYVETPKVSKEAAAAAAICLDPVESDDGWMNRLMDNDMDPVIPSNYFDYTNPFDDPWEGDMGAMLVSTLDTLSSHPWDPTSLNRQRSAAESQEQDVLVTLAWADRFLRV